MPDTSPARVQIVDADGNPATPTSGTGLATSAKQDTAQTTLTAIDGHVDGLETAVASTNTKLDTVNTNLGTLDGHVDGLETAVAATNTALTGLAQPTTVTAVTKNDSTDITATATKGLWVGTGGDLAVRGTGNGAGVTIANVPSGTYIPGSYQRVMSTNTTASNIVSFS